MPTWIPSAARRGFVFILSYLVLVGWSARAWAGGGPEGVLLVVNPQSADSLTIANHYAQLRQIPADNVIYVPWEPNVQACDIDTFRRRILMPVLQTINSRHWGDQIDYVIYSSGYPNGISLESDIRKFTETMQQSPPPGGKSDDKSSGAPAPKPEWPKILTPVGSINGLTYLWQAVIGGNPAYLSLQSNHYMYRAALGEVSRGFRGNRQYSPQGSLVASGGQRYFLSIVLGVTTPRGNTVSEVLAYLRRSAAADGVHPQGTIYFVKNKDIRSLVRDKQFPLAVEELKSLGVAAKILEGTVPLNCDDVQGLVMGTAVFDWKASGSTIRPGAICEHFTSYGGAMYAPTGQTPLSEFLRYGAAGASGTVVEPYSIAEKFPSPLIQVHYARGCTLAEAFYQSVHGPYQLLIVGDPLCRPWADVPQVSVTGIEPDTTVHGSVTLTPTATVAGDQPIVRFELTIDGRLVAACKPGETLTADTTKGADGYHELRIVAVGPAPIESQGHKIVPVWVDNHGRTIEAALTTAAPLRMDTRLTLAVRSPDSVGAIALQGGRIVGRIASAEGQIEIPAGMLGAGPVQLRVVGLGSGDAVSHVVAKPIEFTIE